MAEKGHDPDPSRAPVAILHVYTEILWRTIQGLDGEILRAAKKDNWQ